MGVFFSFMKPILTYNYRNKVNDGTYGGSDPPAIGRVHCALICLLWLIFRKQIEEILLVERKCQQHISHHVIDTPLGPRS